MSYPTQNALVWLRHGGTEVRAMFVDVEGPADESASGAVPELWRAGSIVPGAPALVQSTEGSMSCAEIAPAIE